MFATPVGLWHLWELDPRDIEEYAAEYALLIGAFYSPRNMLVRRQLAEMEHDPNALNGVLADLMSARWMTEHLAWIAKQEPGE